MALRTKTIGFVGLGLIGGSIAKVSEYITIHFWAVLCGCLTNAIVQILSQLNYNILDYYSYY